MTSGRPIDKLSTSPNGIDFIKKWEGLVTKPAPCLAGFMTWGYGHRQRDGEKIPAQISLMGAMDLLDDDLRRDYAPGVRRIFAACGLTSPSLMQYEFDALVSFAYNLGIENLAKSTLAKLIIAGDRAAAAAQFPRWNKSHVKNPDGSTELRVVDGLTNRRVAEMTLFVKGVYFK